MDEGASWSMAWGRPEPGAPSAWTDDRLRLSDVGKLARRARSKVVGVARAEDRPTLTSMLHDHLGAAAETADVVEESWPAYEHVNVQLGLDAWLAGEDRAHRLLGLARFRHRGVDLSGLLVPDDDPYESGPILGNVSWMTLPSGPDGQVHRAVAAGLYLVEEPGLHAAILLLGPQEDNGLHLHVASDDPAAAARIAAEVRELALVHNVFRGQLISFEGDMFGERGTVLHFHTRPDVAADRVILPVETLAMIRRQVVGVAEHRAQLLSARQHLKRGLLLYGPPGVGKTHTVRHLISQLAGVTVVELSGAALQLIGTACSVARTLQPAMVVVEDVDLIAQERGPYGGQHPLLFQLLNEMDGLAEDADVVFLLTTNRADVLEPALAARPGRVDQAVLMELPDAEARRRLFELYRGDLEVDTSRLDSVVARTENVTASFLKELLRRSALIAAAGSDGGTLSVSADQLDEALAELLDTRNAMTRVLLGGQRGAESGGWPAGDH